MASTPALSARAAAMLALRSMTVAYWRRTASAFASWGVTERAHQGRRVVRWHDGFNVGKWSCVSPDIGGGALGRLASLLGAGALTWVAVHRSSSVSSSSGRRLNARAI